ncbi:MAG: efflux RND transporter permease subunit [Sulfuricurvum sp.]|uniref:efflux RND transporter permease subunit n=1 Tax=Sulfuricurvum sp. TaxID=2025608 RepID=UPI002606802C|nr:efflux RND transporter permease subunit [Sulfuricurvum sp.]MDD2830154.1 efflux RND transporter permease subunit [Sulfuricurvum sp.]MDD4950346.1 efflux RND transporter permease subunit [Sulfuricurvum sp.]
MHKIAITRPITTIMFALALIFFGLVERAGMPSALYPNVDFPIVIVTTLYKGSNADIVESKVTDKIEEALSGISGLETLSSDSSKGYSVVVAQFKLSKDLDEAVNDVRDKVSSIQLPNEVDKPIVDKHSADAAPVMTLFLSGSDTIALMKHADEVLKSRLQRIEGVGGVTIAGLRKKQILITPDPALLSKYNLTLNEFIGLIRAQNIRMDGGRTLSATHEYQLLIDNDAKTPQALANLQLKEGLSVGDIAKVEVSLAEEKSYAALDGKSGVLLMVKKMTGANEISIADAIRSELPALQALEPSMTLTPLQDATGYIRDTLKGVQFDLLLGSFLASLIIFLFLRNLTLTLIAAVSLPVSILGVLAIMGWTGQTFNLLTLTALTLAIGIIIDDAIVVIENIFKRLEAGRDRQNAAIEGVGEILFSIVAISAMLLAVFVPVAKMSGIVGRFFTSFGVTIIAAIGVSFVIAITLIPMIASQIAKGEHSRFYHRTEHFFVALEELYRHVITIAIRYKKTTLLSALGIFIVSIILSGTLGMVFMPKEDKSQFNVTLKTAAGTSIHAMKSLSLDAQKQIKALSEVEYCTLYVGRGTDQKANESSLYVHLKPIHKRTRSQKEVMDNIRDILGKMKVFTMSSVTEVDDLGGYEINTPFQIILKAQNAEDAEASAQKLMSLLHTLKGTTDVQSNIQPKAPQLTITVLSENARRLGVNIDDISRVIASSYSGENTITFMRERGKEYDVMMRLDENRRIDTHSLDTLSVRANNGSMVRLSSVIQITNSLAPTTIKRFDRLKKVIVGADLTRELPLDKLVTIVQERQNEWLTKGVSFELDGDAKYMKQSNDAFGVAIGAAIVMIYLILAALYESPLQPIIIMSALPLSFTGAFIGLWAAGMNMSLFSMMGLMLLMGLVGKNSTLVVDAANRLLESGKPVDEAIIEAGISRLRPILMTTTAMTFGMLPLALSIGEGSGVKGPMGVAVICGLILSTITSLIVVPALYKALAPLDAKIRKLYTIKKEPIEVG